MVYDSLGRKIPITIGLVLRLNNRELCDYPQNKVLKFLPF